MTPRQALVETVARAMAEAFAGVSWDTLPEDTTGANIGRRSWRRRADLFVIAVRSAGAKNARDAERRLFAFCEAVLATRAASC